MSWGWRYQTARGSGQRGSVARKSRRNFWRITKCFVQNVALKMKMLFCVSCGNKIKIENDPQQAIQQQQLQQNLYPPQPPYINKEYRGEDSTIIIDGDIIYYKALIRKVEFNVADIISVKWNDAKTFENGRIEITLPKTVIPYKISFKKKQSSLFKELYDILHERKILVREFAKSQPANRIETNLVRSEPQNMTEIKQTKSEIHIQSNKIDEKIKKQELKASKLEYKLKKQELKASKSEVRLKQREVYDMNNMARCPKCGSTSLSANKKGFAVSDLFLFGKFGLLTGGIGAGRVRVTCVKCGRKFWAGRGK